jgi:hypothetical protein
MAAVVDFRLDTAVVETGLKRSWDLYRHLRPDGEAARFWQREWTRLDEKLSIRNRSILARGGNRVSQAGWHTLSQWTETGLLPVLAHAAGRLDEAHELPQLPTAIPAL